ncbi:aldehyde dehydrogenase family protein [Microlunatus elymi]|uniref:L-glutamate gamma-semialdehyde dehydrogenase n=1 Tax=Microlunatus elymi TaxID=2596828 RepID=A0A516PZ74_9ACTN|nr:bifunctional proline dehydrogenase/L-glutamate gamma-semialdehyde dehydrogenase [Microlunatus elymi]QDP96476.1 aldehyde dehydrogenase family protein [Microlunatus elymi]
MTAPERSVTADDALLNDVVTLVRRWLDEAREIPRDAGGKRLANLLQHPAGLDFTLGFVDGVIRPEDPVAAAAELAVLSQQMPASFPVWMRGGVWLGARAGKVLPRLVIPVVRRVLRSLVRHLIIDATDLRLGPAIKRLRADGTRLNLNLLGEAVHGPGEADRRLRGTTELLARPDVDYVSIKVSSAVPPHAPWAFDAAVDDVVERLTPLYQLAARSATPKFINLDMEEYHDLDLTIAVFTRLLNQPQLRGLQAGIVLQAYLPDALGAMIKLQDWARTRRAAGGAPIKVRLVKGANLPMERVDASVHGWPLATWGSKQETDTNYKRVLNWAMQPDRLANVRLGVAGHNLFDIAYAWTLAGQRGGRGDVEFEMLLGMAPEQAKIVKREVGGLLLYTPVVRPREFDTAIAYLVRRLEEGASQQNFMSAAFDLGSDEALFERERQRFAASLEDLDDEVPTPHRIQDRNQPVPEAAAVPVDGGFTNTADSDPSLAANRDWATKITARMPECALGAELLRQSTVESADRLDTVLSAGCAAQREWAALGGAGRAAVLRIVARELERSRADLLQVMGSECGKTLDQSDPEVSEAIDFANWYAAHALELDDLDGAVAVPRRLTVVAPPWNFPVAIPTGSVLAALASGSSVVIKPAPEASRCAAVMVQALWRAGVPRDVLQLVQLDEGSLGQRLIADPRVDQVILTGGYETAELFGSFRPGLRLFAETSGKNAMVVTPSADFDLAARDLVYSAFGHAGQKCSAASLAILVGSVAESRRFRSQLLDAARALTVGDPADLRTRMGPLITPASGKLLHALTTQDDGESWLLRPERLDESGRLWTPGIKTGVRRRSPFHLTEYFGPVLGIMTADSMAEALEIQNEVAYGLTAGLHSLDHAEIAEWIDGVQAGNLYVNRHTTGALVGRQPFGGWKRSAVGAGTKAGGPSYLIGLTGWAPRPAAESGQQPTGVIGRLIDSAQIVTDPAEQESLRRAVGSDAAAWDAYYAHPVELARLESERNVLRHVPVPVTIRLAEDGSIADLVRVAAAGLRAGSRLAISVPGAVPASIADALRNVGCELTLESDQEWCRRLATRPPARIRLVGGDVHAVSEALGGRGDVAIWDGPVTESGRLELLGFLHEQSISITEHRFGNPTSLSAGLVEPAGT